MAQEPPAPFDVHAMLRSIETGADLDWIQSSWERPDTFHRALAAHVARSSARSIKSRPLEGYDLYHDLVTRHLEQGRVAFAWHEQGRGWRTLSYDELHQRSALLESTWRTAGLAAGLKVALVLPCDATWVVAVLTALRMGVVFTVLPPRGATFVQNRLRRLAPDALVAHARYAPLLGSWVDRVLPEPRPQELSGALGVMRSHTSAPGETVAELLSPLGTSPDRAIPLTADQCFSGVLRDAVLVLQLSPGDRVAIPGFETLQHQPSMLLTTLMAGACFVESDDETLAAQPPPRELAPTVIGLTDAGRERALRREIATERWRLWFINPATPYDWERWDRLARHMSDQARCRHMLLLANAAFGGSIFFSPRHPTRSPLSVLPAVGQPWSLMDIALADQPAQGDMGVYAGAAGQADPDAWGRFLLSKIRGEFHLGGSTIVTFQGQSYPATEVIQLAEADPEVESASVVLVPTQGVHGSRVTVLVFAEPSAEDPLKLDRMERRIVERVARELGAGFRPTQVRAFPLVPPHGRDGRPNHEWCRWQFLSGGLDRKAREHMFTTLHGLRRSLELLARGHAPSSGGR